MTFLLFICYLAMPLSNVEAKPHLTNFFMSKQFDNKHLTGWEENQEEIMVAESHLEPVTEGKSEFHFTWEDFPKGNCNI